MQHAANQRALRIDQDLDRGATVPLRPGPHDLLALVLIGGDRDRDDRVTERHRGAHRLLGQQVDRRGGHEDDALVLARPRWGAAELQLVADLVVVGLRPREQEDQQRHGDYDDPRPLEELGAQEHERDKELQLQRKWVHLWRVAGKYANVGVFDVENAEELHEILSSLPLYPFMEIDVSALCHHPGSLEPTTK